MNKKKLLLLTPGFPEDELDTRCIPALQLFLDELIERDLFHLTIISLHYPYQSKEYEWKGIKVYALGGDNKKGINRLLLLSKAIRLANAIHKQKPFDLIHSFWLGQCAWIASRLSKKWGIKHSCTLMGQDVLKENSYLKKIKPLPKLIALSNFQAEVLMQDWQLNPELIIPWGTRAVQSLSKPRTIDLIGVGNLTRLKSFDQFIRIVAGLKKSVPEINAVLIGEGDQKELQNLISSHQLENNVELLGIKNREEVLGYMSQSKCLLHCSNFESFGMVLIEALSCGTKVFSSPVGIAPEIKEIQIFNQEDELIDQIKSFLDQKYTYQAILPFDIKETVNSYINSVF